jgi:hypothetical protein
MYSTVDQSNPSANLTQLDRSTFDRDLQSVSEIVTATEVDLVSLTPVKYRSVYPNFPRTHLFKRGCPKLLNLVKRDVEPKLYTYMGSFGQFEKRRATLNLTQQKSMKIAVDSFLTT